MDRVTEWRRCELGDALTLQRGFDLPHRLRRKGDIPIVSSSGISNRHDSVQVCGPGVVTGRYGTIGEVFYITEDFWPLNTTLYVREFKGNDPLYISYLLRTVDFASHSGKSGVPGINRNDIHKLPIVLPPPTEQRAIAEALSDVDGLLGSLDKLIAKKRAIKQAAMQQLLTGKTRLPGFSAKRAELNMARDSILKARIGWQGLTTVEYLTTGDYYLVTGTDFVEGRVNWSTCYFVDRSRFVQDRNIQLEPSDVLLTKDGTIGKAGFVDSLPGPATLNSGIFVVRPKKNSYFPKYMYYILTSQIFDDFLARLQAGSTISHLYQKDFSGFSFNAPQMDEQRAIATVLSDMDTEIAALEQRRDKTRTIKQGMMQQLLTGRVRLVKSSSTAEALKC